MVLDNSQTVERLALARLGLEHRQQRAEVRLVVAGRRPVGAGQDLLLQAQLGGAADAEDAVVRLPGREALEGALDVFVFLGDEVVGTRFLEQCWLVPILSKGIPGEGTERGRKGGGSGKVGRVGGTYCRPSWRYEAALAYQAAAGLKSLYSHGRAEMKGARLAGIVVVGLCVVGRFWR